MQYAQPAHSLKVQGQFHVKPQSKQPVQYFLNLLDSLTSWRKRLSWRLNHTLQSTTSINSRDIESQARPALVSFKHIIGTI